MTTKLRHATDITRRAILQQAACGFGSTALAAMLAGDAWAEASDPLAAKQPHFGPRAKRVIFLFMHGGVSHVDSFDHKPELTRRNGQPVPFKKPQFEFGGTNNLLASPWKFRPYGDSGILVSDLFPHIGSVIDDVCVINSVSGGQEVSHGPACLRLNTGDGVFARPSLGAWTLYGLGTDNSELPGFISLSPSLYHGGTQNYGSAFLPASFQGTAIGNGSSEFPREMAVPNVKPRRGRSTQQRQLDLLSEANRDYLQQTGPDARLEARIRSFETAFRMQTSIPRVFDLSGESKETQALYGIGEQPTDEYGRECLLARRMAESGVRFIQVNHSYTRNYWDAHGGLRNNHSSNAAKVDKPIAGLIRDLKQRGLFDDTLVVFGTEFGRTPAAQGRDGRDHHPHAFSMLMAGGGIKGGMRYGRTDEFGYYVTENKCTIPDFHATVLHLLGLDHERLTFRHAGRDFRLTDVHGNVVREILA